MNSTNKWLLTDEEKDKFIATLTPNLTILRTSAEISQAVMKCPILWGLTQQMNLNIGCPK